MPTDRLQWFGKPIIVRLRASTFNFYCWLIGCNISPLEHSLRSFILLWQTAGQRQASCREQAPATCPLLSHRALAIVQLCFTGDLKQLSIPLPLHLLIMAACDPLKFAKGKLNTTGYTDRYLLYILNLQIKLVIWFSFNTTSDNLF